MEKWTDGKTDKRTGEGLKENEMRTRRTDEERVLKCM